MSDNFEKTVVYHLCDGKCGHTKKETGKFVIYSFRFFRFLDMKFSIGMEYFICKYFGGISSTETEISGIIIDYVSFVITVNASRINDFTVDYDIGVKMDDNRYLPDYIMTIRAIEAVPNYFMFALTTKSNGCVIKYGNNFCLQDVSEMFMREVEYIIYC